MLQCTQTNAHPAKDTQTCITQHGNAPKPPTQFPIASRSPFGWKATLSSTALDDQRGLIDRARRITAANGALDHPLRDQY
ncbi:hypothetical protein HPB48_006222 [Haemaphysalis longicornis]|uniref:Uncharacterized protein n=1 Tax=Haemaphysalis longicornis TaxID=44386 RepID=A0A9J6FIX4_HAELO|nr:hypothetical protein HPB48_006222 [Haemaphysalis longicornis]